MTYLMVFIGFGGGNFAYAALRNYGYGRAAEITFFQGVAVLVCFLVSKAS